MVAESAHPLEHPLLRMGSPFGLSGLDQLIPSGHVFRPGQRIEAQLAIAKQSDQDEIVSLAKPSVAGAENLIGWKTRCSRTRNPFGQLGLTSPSLSGRVFRRGQHLDTTPYGPGATDDGSGVAVLLETARALQAGPPLRNSVILLFTGPEETGLHGAVAFIMEHPWVEDVKLVINFDAGGLSGPSELTNTSPDNGWLIREAAKADSYIYGSSASGEGSSDFNAFKFYGFSGYAFDYSWDRRIHTPNDNVENLNPASIQHQGYHALSLARHFGNLDSLEDPKDPNPIYFNILRLGFVHYPATWVIPISLVVVLVFAGVVALGFRRKVLTPSGIGLGALVFVISLITAPLLVSVLWALLSNAVPTYKVTYLGHAANEPLLLTLFTSITIALTPHGMH